MNSVKTSKYFLDVAAQNNNKFSFTLKTIIGIDGELGQTVKGTQIIKDEYMTITTGAFLAHDLIEHNQSQYSIGGLDHELQAIGATLITRAQFGTLNNKKYPSCPHEGLVSTLVQLGKIKIEKGIPYRATVPMYQEAHTHDEDITELLEKTRTVLSNELQTIDQGCCKEVEVEVFLSDAACWLQSGVDWVVNACERNATSEEELNTMFWALADQAEKYLDASELEVQVEGQEICYVFCTETNTLTVLDPLYYDGNGAPLPYKNEVSDYLDGLGSTEEDAESYGDSDSLESLADDLGITLDKDKILIAIGGVGGEEQVLINYAQFCMDRDLYLG